MIGMDTFTITATVTYSPMLTPKGCRKPRPVPTEFTHEIEIPRFTEDEAPVAIRYLDGSTTRELRFSGGKLYSPSNMGTVQEEIDHSVLYAHKRFEAIESVDSDFRGMILIGERVWELSAEPVFQVMTFGMGGNHGGTSLSVRMRNDPSDQSSCFHPLNDFPAAIDAARETAEHRGDFKSLPNIGKGLEVEVLIPEAIKFKPLSVRKNGAIESSRLALAEAYATVRTADADNLAKAAAALEAAAAAVRERLSEVGLYSF